MNLSSALLVLALLAQAGSGPVGGSAGGLSRDLSDAMGKKIAILEKFEHDPKLARGPVRVSEMELNSYLRFALSERTPAGLRDIRVTLLEGRIELRGVANLAEFKDLAEKAPTGASLLSLLSGDLSVEVVADFTSDRGFGQFKLVSAQVGPVPLSASVLGDVVARTTISGSRPAGFDIRAPFRLPYSVKRIRAQPALATIEY